MLKITAYDFSTDPLVPACAGSFGVPVTKIVTLQLTVVKDGAEWVGRTSNPAADIEMRFRDAGQLPFGERAFTGSIRGQAPDMGFLGVVPPGDVSVTVSGTGASAAVMDGRTLASLSVDTLTGRAVGEFRFHDSAGHVATCPAVSVWMNVLR